MTRKGKDDKASKLIQTGLGVCFENGFLMFHKSYNSNISNIKILEEFNEGNGSGCWLMRPMIRWLSILFHNTRLIPGWAKKYFAKDEIERSFRTIKDDVQLHPVRLWMPRRVNAYIKICYLSMCVIINKIKVHKN